MVDGLRFADVPSWSVEDALSRLIRWWDPTAGGDPFSSGARWGLANGLEAVYGPVIGPILELAVMSNIELWNPIRQEWLVA